MGAGAYTASGKGVEALLQESHSLRLTERKSLSVTGVTEVVRFDEDAVVLQTDMGTLTVQGEQLQLKELDYPINLLIYQQVEELHLSS